MNITRFYVGEARAEQPLSTLKVWSADISGPMPYLTVCHYCPPFDEYDPHGQHWTIGTWYSDNRFSTGWGTDLYGSNLPKCWSPGEVP